MVLPATICCRTAATNSNIMSHVDVSPQTRNDEAAVLEVLVALESLVMPAAALKVREHWGDVRLFRQEATFTIDS